MHVHRSGSGEPLLLLHGVGHHWQAWTPVLPLLEEQFAVVAADSPGFGRSPALPPGVAPTIWAYADAFETFLREEGLDRPHVAGSSMGGAIGLELARRGAVRSVTAFSPAGFWTSGERRYAQVSLGVLAGMPRALQPAMLAAVRTRPGRAALFAQLVKRPAGVPADEAVSTMQDAWSAPAFAAALKAFDAYEFTAGNELDGATVCIAWGDADRLLPYGRQAPRARAALPHARHATLDAGHLPFTDAPVAVARLVREAAAQAGSTP